MTIKHRTVQQLIDEQFIVPNPSEPTYFEIEDGTTVVYEKENVNSFEMDSDDHNIVMFSTPLGLEHLNEYDCKIDEPKFTVFKMVQI